MILTDAQLRQLEARVTEAQLIQLLVTEVRHYRENAQVPIFVCPECNATEEYDFSCGEDSVGQGSVVGNYGGSHDIGVVTTYTYVCMNCDSRGSIAWLTPEKGADS